ncbi:MAG: nucleotidyl transferase AbiEii/AbiGii toxin family protein, partial [Luteolibacter sp.]
MEPTFEKLLARLADHSVEFLLVGGVAVTLHGYARLTEDVDILIQNSSENINRLLGSLANYGEGFAKELSPEDFTDEEGAIRIVEVAENSQLDIFT